ncbi:MAG TPA: sigma-70 family RNA polymerase sigma factor [Chloroflexota bacterium]|jgi:RNA polymerase sigma-70 factor (ECF subfamily)|nr:sigma-70 family RNA polymerase sigma factor [Chloroflexota bacterium]
MSQGHSTASLGQEWMGDADEEALVRAAQQDPSAFGLLYARYQDRLYTYLRTRLGQAEDAADLTQQVFMQALVALPRYRTQGVSIAAWLFRIARNVATDWQRRQRPMVPWDTLPEAFHPCAEDSADGALLHRETFAPLYTLLAGLDAQTREALVLRFTAQLTLAEIGAVLGKSEEAVRKQVTRALHTLKEQYHDHTA